MSVMPRQWLQAHQPESSNRIAVIDITTNSTDFIIMQWNCLADGLAQEGSFDNVEVQHLVWEYRMPLIVKEIRTLNPDIFCLEELNRIEDMSIEFSDYYVVWAMKLSSPVLHVPSSYGKFPPDGTAIFLRRSRYEILNSESLYYRQQNDDVCNNSDATNNIKLSNQNAVIVIVKDILIQPHQYFMIAATHLKSKSSFQNERAYQIKQLIEKIDQLSTEFQHVIIHSEGEVEVVSAVSLPVIICGDFNDIPESKMYNEILNYSAEERNIYYSSAYKLPPTINSHESSSLLSVDSDYKKSRIHNTSECDDWNKLSKEPLFTTWKSRHNEESKYTGDYIFYFPGGYGTHNNDNTTTNELIIQSITKNRIGLDSVLALPTENEIKLQGEKTVTLPNMFYPSDHLSLAAKFYYARLT